MNGKSIMAVCSSDFKLDGEGAEHLAAFSGMDILDYAWAEQSGGWGVSIPDGVEALFEVVMSLATYFVDGSTEIGSGAKERSGRLGRYLQMIGKEIREFHAIHRRIVVDPGVKS